MYLEVFADNPYATNCWLLAAEGSSEALVVDPGFFPERVTALLDAAEKRPVAVLATHGHSDHVGAAAAVCGTELPLYIHKDDELALRDPLAWGAGFPGQIPDKLVIAEALQGNVIDLEGHEVVAVELGHTDTDYTTCLHVPSIGLVVAGDAAYNDVHLYLVESSPQTRQEWITALDKIESLRPRVVVASHKRPENDDSPRIIEETRQYIRDFDRLTGTTKTAQELYDRMLELYPTRVNPGWALWSSARAAKP